MELRGEADYVVMIISLIAKRYNMTIHRAYEFLSKYKGISFLQEFYDVEHTLSTEDVIDDVLDICEQNGGRIE